MYNPKPPPQFNNPDFDRAFQYIYDELRGVSGAFETLEAEKVRFVERNATPDKPRLGDVYLADGTNWNPLSTTQNNPYFVYHDGTNYNAMSDPPEYGTWTPVVADAASGGNEATVSASRGYYINNGRSWEVHGYLTNINTAGMTAGNDIFITGLPATSSSSDYSVGAVLIASMTFTGFVTGVVNANTSYIQLYENASGSNNDRLVVSEINSGVSDIFFSISYIGA